MHFHAPSVSVVTRRFSVELGAPSRGQELDSLFMHAIRAHGPRQVRRWHSAASASASSNADSESSTSVLPVAKSILAPRSLQNWATIQSWPRSRAIQQSYLLSVRERFIAY